MLVVICLFNGGCEAPSSLICLLIGLPNPISRHLSIVTTLCCNLLPWPTILKAFDGLSLRVMWAMYKRSPPILYYGFYVWGDWSIKFRICLNAKFEKGSYCNLHCKNTQQNLQFYIFFQGARPKPKHRVLILFGLLLMWTFRFNLEFFVLAFVLAICSLHWLFLFIGFSKGLLKEGI